MSNDIDAWKPKYNAILDRNGRPVESDKNPNFEISLNMKTLRSESKDSSGVTVFT